MVDDRSGNNGGSCIFVIFGGTGDLTKRKLMPAFYSLMAGSGEAQLAGSAVVSVGRREMTDEAYRNEIGAAVKDFSRINRRNGADGLRRQDILPAA